jgi:hypothetical protein
MDLGAIFEHMRWAEEEIAAAQERHPDAKEKLFETFLLVQGTHDLMGTEFVYRAHARELLERVYADEDTTVPTNSEIIIGLAETSAKFPLGSDAVTLYARLFIETYPDKLDMLGGDQEAYERVHGDGADRLLEEVRTAGRFRQKWRKYPLKYRPDCNPQLSIDLDDQKAGPE